MKRAANGLVYLVISVVLIFAAGCSQAPKRASEKNVTPQLVASSKVPRCCWMESSQAHHAPYVGPSVVDDRFSFTLKAQPPTPVAGEIVILSVKIEDNARPVDDALGLHPERRVHLTAISENLADFAHVHVTETEGWKQSALFEGTHSMQFTPLAGGLYRLRVDFMEKGAVISKTLEFQVDGPEQTKTECRPNKIDVAGKATAKLSLSPREPMAGREILVRTDFSIDGQPVTDIEPYAGTLVHTLLVGPMKDPQLLHIHGGGQEYTNFSAAKYVANYSGPKTYWATLVGDAGCYRALTQIGRPGGQLFFKHDFKIVEYSEER